MTVNKILAVFCAAAAVLSFSGCSDKDKKPQALPQSYSFKADITHGDLKVKADCTRKKDGGWQIDFTAPDTLGDLSLSCDEDFCTAELGEITQTFDRKKLPLGGTINLLTQMLEQAVKPSGDFKYDRKTKIMTENYNYEGENFTVSFCKDDLYMAEMESEEFSAVITDYKAK